MTDMPRWVRQCWFLHNWDPWQQVEENGIWYQVRTCRRCLAEHKRLA